MEENPNKYTIPVNAWGDFVAKLKKMNKRAAKIGCEPITFTQLGHRKVTRSHTFKTADGEYTKEYECDAIDIEVHGRAPKVEGFEFIAKIEYLSDSKSVLFHTVPGAEHKIDDRFRPLKPSVCEHCNKARMRAETFVVRNTETGAQTQVGRQCLADFTGINTPQKLAAKAGQLWAFSDLREECDRWWGGRFAETIDTSHALALTSAYIAQVGWTPKSAAGEGAPSTAGQVSEHFWGTPTNADRAATLRMMGELAKQPEHQDRAKRVVEWIKTELAAKAKSDYEMNLVTLVVNDLTEQKHLGIVCSAVSAYQRAMNQKVEYAKKRESLQSSQHVGKVGERLKGIPAKVYQVRALEGGDWRARTLVKFLDGSGNLMTWFASGDRDYVPGAEIKITGTVKGHKEYQGVKETQLSRVKASFLENNC